MPVSAGFDPFLFTALIRICLLYTSVISRQYEKMEDAGKGIGLLRLAAMLGLHRLPLFTLAADDGLTEEEYAQAKLLGKRNFMNRCIAAETDIVSDNAALVGMGGLPEIPFLLFCSDGKEVADFWVLLCNRNTQTT